MERLNEKILKTIKNGNIKKVKKLMGKGLFRKPLNLDYLYSDDEGNEYFHYTTLYKQPEILKYLFSTLRYGYSLRTNKNGFNPLHIAVKNGDLESTKVIVNKITHNEADYTYINSLNEFCGVYRTALDMAIEFNHKDIVKYLSFIGVESCLLWEAIKNNKLTYIKDIIKDNDININDLEKSGRQSYLNYAVIFDQFEIAKFLIENNANVNYLAKDRACFLIDAIQNCNLNIVKLLIENGADINYCNTIMTAVRYMIYFRHDVNYNETGNEYIEIIKYLLEKGANINYHTQNDSMNYTALSVAVGDNDKSIDIVEFLLMNGADAKLYIPKYTCGTWRGPSDKMKNLLNSYGANIK